MKKPYAILFFITVITAILLAGGFFVLYKYGDKTLPKKDSTPTAKVSTGKLVDKKLEELELTFKAPDNFFVSEHVERAEEELPPYTYTFTIQNYDFNAKPPEDYFQMYGIYQLDVGNATEEILDDLVHDLVEQSTQEIEVDGNKGIAGVYQGDRGSYVVTFIYNNKLFRISVTQPTEQNIELAKQIISTFKFEKIQQKTGL